MSEKRDDNVLDAHHHPCYIKTGRKQFLITLTAKMKTAIRTNGSPRHVPAKIVAVPGIPYTLNMKKVELAVRKVIGGQPISNRDALMNPEILDHYGGLEELRKD